MLCGRLTISNSKITCRNVVTIRIAARRGTTGAPRGRSLSSRPPHGAGQDASPRGGGGGPRPPECPRRPGGAGRGRPGEPQPMEAGSGRGGKGELPASEPSGRELGASLRGAFAAGPWRRRPLPRGPGPCSAWRRHRCSAPGRPVSTEARRAGREAAPRDPVRQHGAGARLCGGAGTAGSPPGLGCREPRATEGGGIAGARCRRRAWSSSRWARVGRKGQRRLRGVGPLSPRRVKAWY